MLFRSAQLLAAVVIAGFLGLHFSNHIRSALGGAAFDSYRDQISAFYRPTLAVELTLVAAIAIHGLIGVYNILHRFFVLSHLPVKDHNGVSGGQPHARTWLSAIQPDSSRRLHTFTGIILGLFVGGHVLATRYFPTVLNFKFGFDDVAWTLIRYPLLFYPYYFTLLYSGLYHASSGFLYVVGLDSWRRSLLFKAYAVFIVAMCMGVLSGFTSAPPSAEALAKVDADVALIKAKLGL